MNSVRGGHGLMVYSQCLGIMLRIVDIPSGFCLINTGVQFLVGHNFIFGVQQVNEFQIGSICQLVDETCESHCSSGHCHHRDQLEGQCKCWKPLQGS